jgi:Holliday junction resolvasome RuvABC ATP-dependent DNA helicase subunit
LVLEPYSYSDIQNIIDSVAEVKKIKIDCSFEVSKYCRGVPRQAKNQMNNILQFMEIHNLDCFNVGHWNLLRREIGIMPLGLLPLEFRALELLAANQTHGMTLTFLANKLRLDPSTVRRDIEKYLLEQGLIKLDTKRFITKLGMDVFNDCVAFRSV